MSTTERPPADTDFRAQTAPAPPPEPGLGHRSRGWLETLLRRLNLIRDPAIASILPERSLAGRALVLVIVIMTFLATLAAGAVHLVADASNDWSRSVSRETTIQIRPVPGRVIERDVSEAAELAGRVRGVAEVKVFSREEAARLLEPWLGSGLDLTDLPVPRLIVLRLASGAPPDFAALKAQLAENVPNAALDDHRAWLARLVRMADTLVALGLAVLALVLIATGLAVGFATRGAMAGTAQIIDVLHLVGAEDRFIAREFQRHFLRLGLRGAAIGCALAVAFFLVAGLLSGRISGAPGGESVEALFGRFALPGTGYVSVLAIGLVVGAVCAVVSRRTVYRTLEGGE